MNLKFITDLLDSVNKIVLLCRHGLYNWPFLKHARPLSKWITFVFCYYLIYDRNSQASFHTFWGNYFRTRPNLFWSMTARKGNEKIAHNSTKKSGDKLLWKVTWANKISWNRGCKSVVSISDQKMAINFKCFYLSDLFVDCHKALNFNS